MDPAEYTRICNYKVKAQYPEGFSKFEKNNFRKKANTYEIDGKYDNNHCQHVYIVIYVIIFMIVYIFVLYCVNPCCVFLYFYIIFTKFGFSQLVYYTTSDTEAHPVPLKRRLWTVQMRPTPSS